MEFRVKILENDIFYSKTSILRNLIKVFKKYYFWYNLSIFDFNNKIIM